ncbi:Concanavalin A-like lectin/glucanase, subgroup [Artemisia annua]|uniref:Concanavalin A-like lectin/glucanase, subgroup n=1 Tax=Artemisia annua TaxID=35608 RepID=A0A2U1MTY3_ARTAN|nr:Concanavalin A-like lectin/glucanase, subgroup [Artemisia annua]
MVEIELVGPPSRYIPLSLVWILSDHVLRQINCCSMWSSFEVDMSNGTSVSSLICRTPGPVKGNKYLPSGCNVIEECQRCRDNGRYCLYNVQYDSNGFNDIWNEQENKGKETKRFFIRNGGLLLKQQEEADPSLVDNTIIFTSRELEKGKGKFDENRILGRGGQGQLRK